MNRSTERYYAAGFRGEPRPVDWGNPFSIPFGLRPPPGLTAQAVARPLTFDGDDLVLPPVTANAGIRAAYRKRLQAMVRAMHRSTMKWVSAAYRANEPAVATLVGDAWNESDHPRRKDGKFGTGGGSAGTRKLSPTEKAYVASYSGDHFLEVNNELRMDAISPKNKEMVQHLDNAVSKGEIKKGTTLYRGMSREAAKKFFDDGEIKVNATIKDKAFVSTSTSKHVAGSLALGGVMLEIETGEGQKGLEASQLSDNPSENETLLPRNTKMRVVGIVPPTSPGMPVRVKVVTEPDNERRASDSSADDIARVVEQLRRKWTTKFDEGADRLGDYFAQSVSKRTDAQLKKILRDAGISVKFKLTRAQRDVMKAATRESVSLIRSIPEQYFKDVQGAVMQSVATGRDLSTLTKNLEKNYGITHRRAAFIARDQNNKATAVLNRSRQLELGIEEAIWQHSGGGSSPRPSHVAAGRNKERYRISEGWYDPDAKAYIWPGTLPICKCVGRSVIKGFK